MRNWLGFRSGTEEAVLPLADLMEIMSTLRHSAKLNGHYVSSAPEYGPMFLEKIRAVTGGAPFWNPAGP